MDISLHSKPSKTMRTTLNDSPPFLVTAIPPEALSYIFRLAASEPRAPFDTSPLSSVTSRDERASTHKVPWIDARRTYGRKVDVEYIERVQTRRSIVLVSKYWSAVGTPLLYEYVVLRTFSSLLSYSKAVDYHWHESEAQKSHSAEPTTYNVGSYTKFIYINLPTPGGDDRPSAGDVKHIAKRFRACTKLEILDTEHYFDSEDSLSTSIIEEIFDAGYCLRYIKYHIPTVASTLPIAHHTETLQVLSLSVSITEPLPPHTWSSLPPMNLPRLHTLDISEESDQTVFEWLATCKMPELQKVSSTHNWNDATKDALTSFYGVHGARLSSVENAYSAICGLDHIAHFCPSLQEICIGLEDTASLSYELPNLTTVSLYIEYGIYAEEEAAAMATRLETVMGVLFENYAGSLKIIVLEAFEYSNFLIPVWKPPIRALWNGLISRCASMGIRFEFGEGEVVHVPTESSGDFRYESESEFGSGSEPDGNDNDGYDDDGGGSGTEDDDGGGGDGDDDDDK